MIFAKHWAASLDDYAIDLAWSPDGALLAAASAAGGISLFDAATGELKHALPGHADGANALAWQVGRVVPDEPRAATPAHPEDSPYLLATGGQNGCVRFWNPITGAQTAEAKLGNAWVEHLVWQVGRVIPDEQSSPPARPEDSPYLFAAAGRKLVALRADGTIAHTFPDAPKTISALAGKAVTGVVAPGPGSPSPATSTPSRQTRTKMSKLRQTIAKRLVAAQQQAAMLTTFNEVDMSAVMDLRKKYQDDFVKRHGVKLGFMSFFTKAVVQALKEVPGINAQIDGDEIVQNHYYDIGMAVSTDKGLMVPVIRDCAVLDMAGIEKSIADAAKRAREGKITLTDLDGGVFTITNGGIFGSMLSTPILNAPQSAILGLHAINERPVAVNGQVVIRPMMYLALSYDHRLVDGKQAVTFLVKVKQLIEDPARLAIGI